MKLIEANQELKVFAISKKEAVNMIKQLSEQLANLPGQASDAYCVLDSNDFPLYRAAFIVDK